MFFGGTMKYAIYLFLLMIPFNFTLSHDHDVCVGYFPPNKMNIPVANLLDKDQQTGLTEDEFHDAIDRIERVYTGIFNCLLYTSPSPRDQRGSRMPSSA